MSSCRFLSQKNQQLWRHQWCRVDSVAACRCTDARCLDAQLRVRCCKLLQPAIARQCHQQQRRMRSDDNEWSSLDRDGCKCAAFHGVLVQIAYLRCWLCHLAPPAEGSVSGNDPSENRSLRRMRRQWRESGHPARRLAAPQTRAASRAQTAARRQRPHQATAYGSPLTPSRYRRAAAAPPATHNSQRQRSPSKRQP